MDGTLVSTEVIAQRIYVNGAYVVFGGKDCEGKHLRIKVHQHVDIDLGKSYQVEGQDSFYRDERGTRWRQILADRVVPVRLPNALVGPWLERLPNIGAARAERLITTFGDALADVLADPNQMQRVAAALDPSKPRLANKIAAQIYSAMAARQASQPSMEEELRFYMKLQDLGVTNSRAVRGLWRLVGGRGAIERLLRNPYLAAALLPWSQADHLGKCLLREALQTDRISANHPDRVLGAVDSVWKDILATGDTAAHPEAFKQALAAKQVTVDEAVLLAIEKRRIVVSDDAALYRAPGAAWLEDRLAHMLRELEKAPSSIFTEDLLLLADKVATAERDVGLALHEDQRKAVEMLLALPVAVLQGGAGVGKTTVMKVLVSAWESLGGNVVMGAVAGKAALQLMRGTSTKTMPRLAYTIARLLRLAQRLAPAQAQDDFDIASKKAMESINGASILINEKTLLILDEASMVDTPSLYQLVKLLPPGARILLVGDNGQLQPVEIGCVFHDLVEEGSCTVRLTKILRQAEDSPVPAAAAAIRNGELPRLEAWVGSDNGIFHIDEPASLYGSGMLGASQLYKLYDELTKRSSDVMCIAARRITVDHLNKGFSGGYRMATYGTTEAVRLGPLASVTVGEPVVCTKNRYQEGLFNGLLGRVTTATPEEISILWETENQPRTISREAAAEIELAYAITCHRSQGSAARYVIVCVEDSPLVTREWLYTAITRTRETIILVGRDEAVKKAVSRRSRRLTGFNMRMYS